MSFVRTYNDGVPIEILRNRTFAPMQSEKVWMPGVVVKLMRPPSAAKQGPIIQESYLVSFTDGSVGEFDTGHMRAPQPKKQMGRSIFPKKGKK